MELIGPEAAVLVLDNCEHLVVGPNRPQHRHPNAASFAHPPIDTGRTGGCANAWCASAADVTQG
ncbi:MAG TPA: hypothetical protein VHI10_03095 [Mycobacterium sp.]|nr:hypothetical protein [Mycobacterium sp.]